MSSTTSDSRDSSPLVQGSNHRFPNEDSEGSFHTGHAHRYEPDFKTRGIVWGVLSFVFVAALVVLLFFQHLLRDSFYPWLGLLPGNTTLAALAILNNAPIIVRFVLPH